MSFTSAADIQLSRGSKAAVARIVGCSIVALERRGPSLTGGDNRVAPVASEGGPALRIRPEGAAGPSGAGGFGYADAAANNRVKLTAAPDGYLQGPPGRERLVGECRPTTDRADRAHLVRLGGGGMLLPASKLKAWESRPRRYPEHQFTSRGGTHEQAADELHRREQHLAWLGLDRMRADGFEVARSDGVEPRRLDAYSSGHFQRTSDAGGFRDVRAMIDRNRGAFEIRHGGPEDAGSQWLEAHGCTPTGAPKRPRVDGAVEGRWLP
mgnify:CR=1 FL=1